MNVCDKCKKGKVTLSLKFKTKTFDLCDVCALKIVVWLEDKPLKEKMTALWDKTNRELNLGTIGGNI